MAKIFIDTNLIVYAFSNDPKADRAKSLLQNGFVTSVKALNEFLHVSLRRLGMSLIDAEDALLTIKLLCDEVLPISLDTHENAIALLHRYKLSTFDAMMVSCALQARCERFLSEDMQHGLTISNQLTIENPFRAN